MEETQRETARFGMRMSFVKARSPIKQREGECDFPGTKTHDDFRSPCSAPMRTAQFGMKISFTNTRSLSLRSATTLGTFHPSRIRAVTHYHSATTLGTFLELVKYAIGALCLERIVTPYPNKKG